MKRKDTGKPPRARPAGNTADPYQKARRPRPPAAGGEPSPFERRGSRREPGFGSRVADHEAGSREPRFGGRERAGREGGGFTVTLDPDVARVFRGDASVNKALRLVMQLMQVVQGPPRGFGSRAGRPAAEPRRGYQGSAEARGFSRKPRFADDDEQ